MRKSIIYFVLISCMIVGCGTSQRQKDINEISVAYSNFPESQKKIAIAYKLNIDACEASSDPNAKLAIQVKFNNWIENMYLIP